MCVYAYHDYIMDTDIDIDVDLDVNIDVEIEVDMDHMDIDIDVDHLIAWRNSSTSSFSLLPKSC